MGDAEHRSTFSRWASVAARVSRCRVALVAAAATLGPLTDRLPSGPQAVAAEPPQARTVAASTEQIDAWIADLGSSEYARREASAQALAAQGQTVIAPLVAAIVRAEDLEVTTRGIEILQGFLLGDDEAVATAAEQMLERLATGENASAARLAAATLEFHHVALADESRARLESLGATIETTMLPDGRVGLHVTINDRWTGAVEDLKLVSRLPQVLQLSVHGVRLGDQAVGQLSRLRRVDQIALYNTDLSDAAVARLTEALPATKLDLRKGGKLGVGGQPLVVPCIITQVQPGSAAEKAGIRVGDVIRSFDGQRVESFEDLTNKIGMRGPGEQVQISVERGGNVSDKKLALDGWQ